MPEDQGTLAEALSSSDDALVSVLSKDAALNPHLPDRQQLFDVEQPIKLSRADFEALWQTVDNVWLYKKMYTISRGVVTKYTCRLACYYNVKDTAGQSAKIRILTQELKNLQCSAGLRITELSDGSFELQRCGKTHNHALAVSDQWKLSSSMGGKFKSRRSNNRSEQEQQHEAGGELKFLKV